MNDVKTREMMRELQNYFETEVKTPLIRHGKRQRIEILINEEALLLAARARSFTSFMKWYGKDGDKRKWNFKNVGWKTQPF
ncbi:hypothetical protein ACFL0D_04695 [Thermoproteota archaeon]